MKPPSAAEHPPSPRIRNTGRQGFRYGRIRLNRRAPMLGSAASGKEVRVKNHLRFAILSLLTAPLAALAQTPECPCPCPCPAPPPPPPVWFGKADLSFLSTSGNTDTTSIGGSLELNYNPKPWLFTLKGAALHAATDGVTTAETFTA